METVCKTCVPEMKTSVPDPYDWQEQRLFEVLKETISTVTHTDYFDFRDETNPRSSVYASFSEKASSKISGYFKELATCLEAVIWSIGDATDRDGDKDMLQNEINFSNFAVSI